MTHPTSTTALPLSFSPTDLVKKTNAATNKIGWLHTIADKPGATFDIVIKDGLGRVKYQRKNCTTETEKFGELANIPTLLGEQLEVSLENVRGAEKVDVFLN